MRSATAASDETSNHWLQAYYLLRTGALVIWITLALVIGKHNPVIGSILLVVYPIWDAFANYLDTRRSGGYGSNLSQILNSVVSLIVAIAISWALTMNIVLAIKIFGAWAITAGLLQVITAVGRWRISGGQWAMILSGVQSAAAGAFFFKQASSGVTLDVTTIVPYAGFGAVYFLISAISLAIKNASRRSKKLTTE